MLFAIENVPIPGPIGVTVVVAAVALPAFVAGSIYLGARAAGDLHPIQLALANLLGFGLWGTLVVAWSVRVDDPGSLTAIWILLSWGIPIAAMVAWFRFSPRLRAALATRAGLWRLAAVETGRTIGVVFLFLHHRGDLPGLFAYPAAWGDVLIGVTAPAAAWVVFSHFDELVQAGSRWRRLFVAWNVVGIADMVMALGLGVAHFPGVLQLVGGTPDTTMFAQFPMALFPAFLVASATAGHFIMLDAIRSATVPERRAVDTALL